MKCVFIKYTILVRLQFFLSIGDTKSKGRPRSARAAAAVLTGEKSDIEPQQLQLRKALAERLRAEVVATNK
ncbi:unnamed protein product [Diabrotica balteata]|uniref:Uncharacterized protein n=1 Tax=Diabrotica balteata TaxID=107213 RepID=A0A9N9T2W3_DIABA|nr:unnamed protein product [Diabrotica balteata]